MKYSVRKSVPKVYMPNGVRVVNPQAKISPGQQRFAKWEVGMVKKFIKVK